MEKKIESADDLSIEHKEAWQQAENPIEKFYNLENIAFSHLGCNCSFSNREINRNDSYGERHYRAKFTFEQIKEIRKKAREGNSQISIAKEYSVSKQYINAIVLFKSRKNG